MPIARNPKKANQIHDDGDKNFLLCPGVDS
jgi:hypothetical protein